MQSNNFKLYNDTFYTDSKPRYKEGVVIRRQLTPVLRCRCIERFEVVHKVEKAGEQSSTHNDQKKTR